MLENLLELDGQLLLWIQDNLRADWLTPLMRTVTTLGEFGMIWILISFVLLCFKRTRKAGAAGIVGLLFSLLLNNVLLKNLVARTRPYEVIAGLQLLGAKATDLSFPSGHAGSSFACAVAVCRMLPEKMFRWRWLLIAFAVLMSISRLYIGIHYPSDVIAGIVFGTFCGFAAAWTVRAVLKKLSEK